MAKTGERARFRPVGAKLDLAEVDHRILDLWEREDTFEMLRKKNAGGPRFSFFDGPITANVEGMGVHSAWARTYKDIYQRYKAMRGFDQRYQNGFDCQGLWVEVQVERELNLNSKRDIETYGIGKFSDACRARVDRSAAAITKGSIRMGQWMDWANSYFTYSDLNISHIWHVLKVCQERGWLYKGHRSMPWCARCGTALSQHEMIDSYREMTHLSVYVRFPIEGRKNESFLVWTTTPWTLPANVALAVNPDLDYVRAKVGDEILIVSKETFDQVGQRDRRRDGERQSAPRSSLQRSVRRATGVERGRCRPPRDRVEGCHRRGRDRSRPHRAGLRRRGLRAVENGEAPGPRPDRRDGALRQGVRLA